MRDDLDIRGGGAVAVDTATLRAAADRFAQLSDDLADVAVAVAEIGRILWDASSATWEPGEAIEAARRPIVAAVAHGRQIVDELRFAADVYELTELRAQRAAAEAAGDQALVARLDARIGAVLHSAPDADRRSRLDALTHALLWPGELARQSPAALWWLAPGFGSLAVPATWALLQGVAVADRGRIPASARLTGAPKAVIVVAAEGPAPARAPASLADAAARMPSGDTRIRVERYTMVDGSRQFAVYVTGTRTVAANTTEPFDMASNLELYAGERSASYDATLEALADAGARGGDVVHAFGHSQGAVVTAHLALEGGFETRTLVSFGSPVEADVGDGTLSVTLRHHDDPVAALAGGGSAAAVGAAGSFVAARTADPDGGIHDVAIPGHGIDTYTRTAQLLDDSSDPRMDAVRGVFAELGGAASVDVLEYTAGRVPVASAPEPGPAPVSPASSDGG